MSIPCKIGTIPMVIAAVDRRTPLEVGNIIRIKECPSAHWTTVKLTEVWENGYFKADRI